MGARLVSLYRKPHRFPVGIQRAVSLLHHAEAQMNRLLCFDHFDRFKRDMLAAHVLVQSYAAAEQHGDEVNRDFVNETGFDG